MKIENFLKNLDFDQLKEVSYRTEALISDYKDGYLYICEVRSYGRNWKENWILNEHTLQKLCYEYNGDNGIVDVYSTNPDLSKIDNYGCLMFIKSETDYELWKNHKSLIYDIKESEQQLDRWEDRDNLPFNQRPMYEPFVSREVISEMKLRLENYDMSFESPVSLKVYDDSDI